MERKELIVVGFVVLAASLMGAGGLYFLSVKRIVQVIDARDWPEVPRVVVSSSVRSGGGEGTHYSAEVSYEYEVEGKRYLSSRYGFFPFEFGTPSRAQEIVNRLPPGKKTVCYVNRGNPKEAVINRGLSSDLWWGLIPVVLLLCFSPGMYGLLMRIYGLLTGRRSQSEFSYLDGNEVRRQLLRALVGSCLVVIGIVVILFVIAWLDV